MSDVNTVVTEEKWKKLSDKKYQRKNSEGEWVTIDVPYGKVELIFTEFIGEGGMIDPATGAVVADLPTLITKFKSIGNIVLTEFDAQGEVKVAGNCKVLSPDEIPALFEIAVDILETFTDAIKSMKKLNLGLMA
jgi:hypothetical protein